VTDSGAAVLDGEDYPSLENPFLALHSKQQLDVL
jgi:hypothetical protein